MTTDGDDDAPELTEEIAARAQIAVGGKVVREATGTATTENQPELLAKAREIAEKINADARMRLICLKPEYDTIDMGESLIVKLVEEYARPASPTAATSGGDAQPSAGSKEQDG